MNTQATAHAESEAGFSYIDVMIAMMILLVGCLALAAAVVAAVVQSRGGQQQLAAKQYAVSSLESILAAREPQVVSAPGATPAPSALPFIVWSRFGMSGSAQVPAGIFVAGKRDITPERGADNIIGTIDDTGAAIPNFKRQITIENTADGGGDARLVTVMIFYTVGGGIEREEKIKTIVTNHIIE